MPPANTALVPDDLASASPVLNPGKQLVLSEHKVVSGYEVWGEVLLESSGVLEVTGGGHLVADRIRLTGNCQFIVEGGRVDISPRHYTDSTAISGTCSWFQITKNSLVRVIGPDGGYDVFSSKGGSAAVDVVCIRGITVRDSIIEVMGGDGFSPPEALTDEDLDGGHFSGGDARLSLCIESQQEMLFLFECRLTVEAGDGGTAPDGKVPPPSGDGTSKGIGGGFTRGGDVGGRVGAGGEASMHLSACNMELTGLGVEVKAGHGGDAGDGAGTDMVTKGGGGGGGYSGGDGASGLNSEDPAGDGGSVSGEVGSGGSVILDVSGDDVKVDSSSFKLLGGQGGDAGNGGGPAGGGGGGGGGYSGGGGGSFDTMRGADGGNVSGAVGAGGDVEMHLEGSDSLKVGSVFITAVAGNGGAAGDGGDAGTLAGGGGGGYTGGGGGGEGPANGSHPGNGGGTGGQVGDRVGSGGSSSLSIESYRFIAQFFHLTLVGGKGGPGGQAGKARTQPDGYPICGGGGGGYSAGGGGGAGHKGALSGSGGGAHKVLASVCDGGDANLTISSEHPSIHRASDIDVKPGTGGPSPESDPGGPQGRTRGRVTFNGEVLEVIPMSEPVLWNPGDRQMVPQPPLFTWMPVYRSSDHGDVDHYRFTISRDNHLSDVVAIEAVRGTDLTLHNLEMGTYYWKVVAIYQGPPLEEGPTPRFLWFRYYNAPPIVISTPVITVLEGDPKVIYMGAHIHDPDTPDSELKLEFDDPAVQSADNLSVSVYYKEWRPKHNLTYWVTDGVNRVQGNITVVVIDKNEPPVVFRVGGKDPPFTFTVTEMDDRWYMIEAEDPDGDNLTYRLLSDWSGANLTPSGNLNVHPTPGDLGWRTIRVSVGDGRGGVVQFSIMVNVVNAKEPPDPPEVIGPSNGSVFKEGEVVTFTARVSDPDTKYKEVLTTTWRSDISGIIGSRTGDGLVTMGCDTLPPGHHRITVIVDDGTFTQRAYLDLTIEEREEPSSPPSSSDLWMYVLFSIMFALMVSIGLWAGYKAAKQSKEREAVP